MIDAVGRRTRDLAGTPLADVVWIADAGRRAAALAEVAELAAERARLRAALDALPLPIWRRSAADLALVDCNVAYAAAVDATSAVALAEGREIATGVLPSRGRALAERARATAIAQSESQHIVINGSRRLVEFTEAPLAGDGGIVGYARTSPPRSPSTAPIRGSNSTTPRSAPCGASSPTGLPASQLSARSSSACASVGASPNTPISAPSRNSNSPCSPR